jgi:FMN phosphatase YigB (HAD superfamily)
MAIKTVLIDMDGTLLNMGESAFENEYIKRMVIFLEQRYPGKGKELVKAVGYGGEMMKHSDGSRTNYDVFWESFEKASGYTREEIEPVITVYYQTDYTHIGDDYVPDQDMQNAVRLLQEKGYELIVATTPVVPLIANQERVRWSGLADIPWKDITSFETYNYSKPNLNYYQQICDKYNLNPAECMMIGDSLVKDFPSTELGMDFFLILNADSPEAEQNFAGKKGDRKALLEYVQNNM